MAKKPRVRVEKEPVNRPFRGLEVQRTPARSARTFVEAMKSEGTLPLADGVQRVPLARWSEPRASVGAAPAFRLERDDDWLEGSRAGLPAAVVRRLAATPTATLDLHGDDTETARGRVRRFVAGESARGRELVLIIVGRGRHSAGGRAVLREEIAEWLTTPPASASVLAFRTAPHELGGSGAVVVLLVSVARSPRRSRA